MTAETGNVTANDDVIAQTGNVDAQAGNVIANGNVTAETGNVVAQLGNVTANFDVSAGRDVLAGDDVFVADNLGVGLNTDNLAVWPDGYRLAVAGNIMCEEVRVELQGSWPDYVFSPGYQLMSLPELEKSIQENGHLPNVPSATAMEADGLKLGEMQRIMMEKIEELTLYVIQQQKNLEKLEAENQALRIQLEKLQHKADENDYCRAHVAAEPI
ncbi:MAG: hypothetical protein IPM82_30565 [Saprospiraceae bacterium]|nr:hypothetical protein [Saprospiraceae bacterium]